MSSAASRWFQERIKGLPAGCVVRAPVRIRPDKEPGEHVSAVLRRGWRTWAFPTEQEAEAFKIRHGLTLRHR